MHPLATEIDAVARESAFSGVVRVDIGGETVVDTAYGFANRAHEVPNTADTRIAIASGNKVLTALAVMQLVEQGSLSLDTPVRRLLGEDLPLIDDAVTVEHLLSHRSGIGDYLDEENDGEITDYVVPVPVHTLTTAEAFVPILDGHATKFAPGTQFSYCNGGFMVLAVAIERVTGRTFHDVVEHEVVEPAGMQHTAFLRTDELPRDAALGYLFADGLRTNVLHLPVRGNGDGGIYTTAADVHALWHAFESGQIVGMDAVADMVRLRSSMPDSDYQYGLGLWLRADSEVRELEGYDAGASFRSVRCPDRNITYSVLANWSNGAWPIAKLLRELLGV